MARPVPGGEFTDAVDGMVADADQNIPEIGLGIKAVELGALDQGVDDGGALAADVRCDLMMPGVWGGRWRSLIRSIRFSGSG